MRRAYGDEDNEAKAAVAVILRERAGAAEALFMRRAESPTDRWSGQMAFPGGRREPSDTGLVHTARRETLEEVGVNLEAPHAELVGPMKAIKTVTPTTSLVVQPIGFVLKRDQPTTLGYEASEALWIKLGPLGLGNHSTTHEWTYQQRAISFPAYDVNGRIIWGLTYRMLQPLFR